MLPHPYESKEQYERSLRLPMGKEWVTRETFHDGTKPRVIMKPGVIAPISRPTA
jgi:U3 small nucleolar RNA-associated protein 14